MYKDYRLEWTSPIADENGYYLVSTRIECMENLLSAVLQRMPTGEYKMFCQSDEDGDRYKADESFYGDAFAEAGLGALASATAVNTPVIEAHGVFRWHLVDEKHNPHVAERTTYTHNYMQGSAALPTDYYDKVETYSIRNRLLLIDEAIADL